MITKDNYYFQEMNMKYMGSSQFKSFMQCEAGALAELKGEYAKEKTTSMMVGSYVDAYFEGSMKEFTNNNPDIFLKNGGLKAEYRQAEYIIERLNKDEMFQKYMSGEKQVVKTGEIAGVPFKIRIDSFHPKKAIVDLKIMKDFERVWKDGLKISFIESWGYDIQGAIYQAIEGNNLPFFIAAATKEKPEPDIAIISINQERLDYCFAIVKDNVQRFADIKKGLIAPERCEQCPYCKRTKVLTEIIDYNDIGA